MSQGNVKVRRIESATNNMSALIDDMVKKALKNFKANGAPELDAKFLKESVGALRELCNLLGECDGGTAVDDGIVIRFENQLEEWGR